MRRDLITFGCGFLAGAIAVWGVARVRGIHGNSSTHIPASSVELVPRPPSPLPQPGREQRSEPVPADQGPPVLPLRANSTNMSDMAQTLLIQHLHPQLQAALKQYPSLDSKNERSALADDVANLVDDDVPVPEVVEALGVMFHQERTVEVKTDILNNLLNLEDPSSYQLIIQGLDPNQPQEVRTAAISVLGGYDDSWAVPTLQQLLSDSDAEIRQAAQDALAERTNQTAAANPLAP